MEEERNMAFEPTLLAGLNVSLYDGVPDNVKSTAKFLQCLAGGKLF
jgi:hypothetical protein